MPYLLIDPNADKDYTLTWVDWLDGGVTITTFVWSIFPLGPTLHDQADATPASTIFVSGCTAGVVYELTCTITTNNTPVQVDDRSITLRCQE